MKTRNLVLVPTVAAALMALSACGPSSAPPAKVCTDASGIRVDDSRCDPRGYHGGFVPYAYRWHYFNNGYDAPEVGSAVRGGSVTARPGTSYGAGVARGGISRGGFGSSGFAHGGFGE